MRLSSRPFVSLPKGAQINRIVQGMDAVTLGPVVLSIERFSALLGFVTLVAFAEVLARRRSGRLSLWASNAVLVSLLGARLGFVFGHLPEYWADPLSIFYIWQGGFSALSAVAAGFFYTLWFFRKERPLLRATARPIVAALVVWLAVSALGMTPTGSATSLPEMELETLSGAPVSLRSFAGKPTVLNLWATWCGPCKREMPLLAEVASERTDIAFVFVDLRERPQTVTAYLAAHDLTLNNVLLDRQGELAGAFRSKGTPTSLFFDAQGELVARHLGELSRASLNDYLRLISADTDLRLKTKD